MSRLLRKAASRVVRFRRNDDGAATIEFVILFTPMVMMMLMGAEAGLLNLRHAMLERGVDVAIRAVRLSPDTPPDHAQIKKMICDQALLIPDCENALSVEMRAVAKDKWDVLQEAAICRDRSEEVKPPKHYNPAAQSELVLVRACVKARPIFPTAGLGAAMVKDGNGDYAAVATSAFVNEPR
ncbi:pilus assembly protein [Maribius pontilimi]|uniref:Pilus assembly protein n=1 Tax=Palleronia pontilimi TaxID=1964209 RepID=A0A934IH80_9RHOB|nr:TadE/TadG family type IV pilus assembly protein [Palleronia pontilimi]MBJ3761819.1 pilus assembly protein [Palleronia pontilimi]